jgi:hypothetical protein
VEFLTPSIHVYQTFHMYAEILCCICEVQSGHFGNTFSTWQMSQSVLVLISQYYYPVLVVRVSLSDSFAIVWFVSEHFLNCVLQSLFSYWWHLDSSLYLIAFNVVSREFSCKATRNASFPDIIIHLMILKICLFKDCKSTVDSSTQVSVASTVWDLAS